jgi:dihydroorotase
VKAIIEAIKDDTIDAFTTDHAPHTEPEKLEPFQHAAFGSTGLETSFAVMNTYLVKPKHISLSKGISKMTVEPAQIIRINKGTLSQGADADIAIFDTKQEWTVDADKRFSKGKNCVFNGKKLTGRAVCTIVGGRVKFRDGRIL